MNYTKLTYDLNGSAYQPKQINVPTDSTYAIGVEFVKEGERLNGEAENYKLIDGDTEISATTTLNGIGIFELSSSSDVDDDKSYIVNYKQEPFELIGEETVGEFVNGYCACPLSDLVDKYNGVVKFEDMQIAIGSKTTLSYIAPVVIKYYPNSLQNRIVFASSSPDFNLNNIKYVLGTSQSYKHGWVAHDTSKATQFYTDADLQDITFQDMIDAGATYLVWGRFTGVVGTETYKYAIKYGKTVDYRCNGIIVNQTEDGKREINSLGNLSESTFEFQMADGTTKVLKVLTTSEN